MCHYIKSHAPPQRLIGSTSMDSADSILNYDQAKLSAWCDDLGEQRYRAQQIINWVHKHGVINPEAMVNVSKSLRHKLIACAHLPIMEIAYHHIAHDGTEKWLLRLHDGNCIETVFIPEASRGTLCISSQVGCILNCDFCATGKQGFSRNLSTAEIIGQLWFAKQTLAQRAQDPSCRDHSYQNKSSTIITNVVMMGMGEPLLNWDNVYPALNLMLDHNAYGLAKRRVTVSTAGIVPAIYQLAEHSEAALAVSLHAPDNNIRNKLVPINKKYPLDTLLAACRYYCQQKPQRTITMEYVMLAGVNDDSIAAKKLIKILNGIPVKMNLIPFNSFNNTTYVSSSSETIKDFQRRLINAGIYTSIRKTRGDDVNAACGQLTGSVKDRTTRQAKYKQHLATIHA